MFLLYYLGVGKQMVRPISIDAPRCHEGKGMQESTNMQLAAQMEMEDSPCELEQQYLYRSTPACVTYVVL
jgi:hypothetical protein